MYTHYLRTLNTVSTLIYNTRWQEDYFWHTCDCMPKKEKKIYIYVKKYIYFFFSNNSILVRVKLDKFFLLFRFSLFFFFFLFSFLRWSIHTEVLENMYYLLLMRNLYHCPSSFCASSSSQSWRIFLLLWKHEIEKKKKKLQCKYLQRCFFKA